VWDDLRERIDVERELLDTLVESFRPLVIEVAGEKEPTLFELNALGSFLQSYYNGIENIFKQIVKLVDRAMPRGESWHQELLNAMSAATTSRPAVISAETRAALKDYMDFRHVFRHGYGFRLDWKRMGPVVHGAEGRLKKLENELDQFLAAGGKTGA
jgi:hypothetical protein